MDPAELEYVFESNRINPYGKSIAGTSAVDKGSHWEYRYDDPGQYWAAFEDSSELFDIGREYRRENFLFRGHADARWDLIPTVMRNLQKHEIREYQHGLRVGKEFELFTNFVGFLDKLGFHLNNETLALLKRRDQQEQFLSMVVRPEAGVYSFDIEARFPTDEHLAALAIAQHYGLPTRLLDFSLNPYKAMFFSLIEGQGGQFRDTAIWVLPKVYFRLPTSFPTLRLVETPGFQNENCVAQEGVFVNYFPTLRQLHPNDRTFPADEADQIISLDRYLQNQPVSFAALNQIGKPMKFVLDGSRSNKDVLNKKLEHIGLNWLSLMPNLEGAAKEAARRYMNTVNGNW